MPKIEVETLSYITPVKINILLMVQKSQTTTPGCAKPCKYWDKVPEQRRKPWLVVWYRGLYYPVIWGL